MTFTTTPDSDWSKFPEMRGWVETMSVWKFNSVRLAVVAEWIGAADDLKGDRNFGVECELMRMFVVFVHAVFEDSLRRLIRYKMPQASCDAYKDIPLLDRRNQELKFGLQDLAEYRGQTVDDVINQSVDQYFETLSFSTTSKIIAKLESVGVRTHKLKPYLPSIASLLKRRNNIVHRADRVDLDGFEFAVDPILGSDMAAWHKNAMGFVLEALYGAAPAELEEELRQDVAAGLREHHNAGPDGETAKGERELRDSVAMGILELHSLTSGDVTALLGPADGDSCDSRQPEDS